MCGTSPALAAAMASDRSTAVNPAARCSRSPASKAASPSWWASNSSIPKLVGLHDLAITVRHADLHEYATGKHNHNAIGADHTFYGITRPVARPLAWLIRHDPATPTPARPGRR